MPDQAVVAHMGCRCFFYAWGVVILDQLPTVTQSLINRISQRMYKIVRVYHHDPIELFGSCICSLYGLLLVMPWQTYASSKGFDVLKDWMPEPIAGAMFLVIGLRWLSGVLLENRRPRLFCSFLAFVMYTYWAVMLFVANPPSLGWATYGSIALLDLWGFWRNCSRA